MDEKKMDSYKEDECPECESHRIECNGKSDDGMEVYYDMVCNDCGCRFSHCYNLTYYGTSIKESGDTVS